MYHDHITVRLNEHDLIALSVLAANITIDRNYPFVNRSEVIRTAIAIALQVHDEGRMPDMLVSLREGLGSLSKQPR